MGLGALYYVNNSPALGDEGICIFVFTSTIEPSHGVIKHSRLSINVCWLDGYKIGWWDGDKFSESATNPVPLNKSHSLWRSQVICQGEN